MKQLIDIIKSIEGYSAKVYTDTLGNRTIGYGFNLDDNSARKVYDTVAKATYSMNIIAHGTYPKFDELLEGSKEIDEKVAGKLVEQSIRSAYLLVVKRARELGINAGSLPLYHQFILTDIAYNTGSISGWTKVFKEGTAKGVLKEARRRQRELDSRVAKIGYQLGIIDTLDDAHKLGLTEAKYLA